jgi:PAS domain S-box-containing protein
MAQENLQDVIADLRKSLAWLDLVLATLDEGVITLEKDLKIHFANDAIANILGINRIFLFGSPLWKVLPLSQNGKQLKKKDYTVALAKNNIQLLSGIYTLTLAEKTLVVDVAFGYIPKIKQIALVVRDITQLQQETLYVKLQQEIAVAANESKTFEEAMSTGLELVCTSTKWPIGHVYFVTTTQKLVSTDIWYLRSPRKFSTFRNSTNTKILEREIGLPGRVLATGKFALISDINLDQNFPRIREAKIVGITSGIAFPVLVREEVVAILEFFSTESIEPSESLLKVMANIGTQLGRVIERSRSEEERLKLTRAQAARAEAEATRQTIQLSEIRHRTMIEQSPLSIQILSPDGTTLQVNKAWENLWGVTLDQIDGYNMLKDEQLKKLGIMPYIQKGFSGKSTIIPAVKYEPEKTIKNITHVSARFVRAFIYPVKDEKGKVQEVVLIHEDITQQRQNEQKLKESEERFRTLIEKSTDAIQLVNPSGTILYTSESIKNVLGYKPEELQGLGIASFVHPDDLQYFSRELEQLSRENGKQITLQYQVLHKDGSWAWLETTFVNHLDTPNITALVGTFRNITERKKYEEELRYQKTLLEAQREVSPEGVLVVSSNGKMVSYNKRFVEMWKFSKKLMNKGKDELALQAATQQLIDPEGFIATVQEVYKSHKQDHAELYFKDGRVFDRFGSPIIGEDGTDYGYVWFFQDISERKRLESQKDDFLGIASHELKTPVTSIKAYTQILENRFKKAEDIKSAELVGKMDGQLNKLTNLIADLLDVTKIESGKLLFREDYFDFNELVSEIVEEMERTTDKHSITQKLVKTRIVFGDRDRIGQVITNFISNAIKYSPLSNKIIVSTKIFKDTITLGVQDFGIGMSKKDQAKVFDRFYRVGDSGQETYPGLGLGLYISAEIIRRHRGKVWVESQKGKGSTFYFSLPIKSKKNV